MLTTNRLVLFLRRLIYTIEPQIVLETFWKTHYSLTTFTDYTLSLQFNNFLFNYYLNIIIDHHHKSYHYLNIFKERFVFGLRVFPSNITDNYSLCNILSRYTLYYFALDHNMLSCVFLLVCILCNKCGWYSRCSSGCVIVKVMLPLIMILQLYNCYWL